MLGKKKIKKEAYDPAVRVPAMRCSICTGEKTAGFRNLQTGKFEDVMLIRDDKDLKSFCEQYGITGELEKIY